MTDLILALLPVVAWMKFDLRVTLCLRNENARFQKLSGKLGCISFFPRFQTVQRPYVWEEIPEFLSTRSLCSLTRDNVRDHNCKQRVSVLGEPGNSLGFLLDWHCWQAQGHTEKLTARLMQTPDWCALHCGRQRMATDFAPPYEANNMEFKGIMELVTASLQLVTVSVFFLGS